MKTTKKQKPIEVDLHLRYRCPKVKCGYDHWISLRQARTKNFKIVCDCGNVFNPKQVIKIKVLYKNKTKKKFCSDRVETKPVLDTIVSEETKNSCSKLLMTYGFTKEESFILIDKAHKQSKIDSPSLLVKFILQNLETLNDFS